MQIKKLSLIGFMLLSSNLLASTNFYVKDNLTKEIEYNKKNKLVKNNQDFFQTDDQKLYDNYSKMEKSKLYFNNDNKSITDEFLLPLMYIKIDDINELEEIVTNVSEVYQLKIDSDAYEYLNTHIYNDTIIDLSQRRYTYEEMVKKIAFKYNLVYERVNNDFLLHLYDTKDFFIPNMIDFDTKLALNGDGVNIKNVFTTIKSFMTNPSPINFNYDTVSNILYVKDRPQVLDRIEKYIYDLTKLTNIQYNIDMFFIDFSNKYGKEIDWELMQKQLDDFKYINQVSPLSKTSIELDIINEDVDTENEILYHFLELLNKQGDAKISFSTQFKTINQKKISYKRGNDFTYLSDCKITNDENGENISMETKEGNSYFNINVTPSYDINSKLNNILIEKNMKELISLNKIDFDNGCEIQNPIFNKTTSNEFFTIKDNSYIIMNSSRDLKNFEAVLDKEELTDVHGKVESKLNESNKHLSGSIILFKVNKINNRNIIH